MIPTRLPGYITHFHGNTAIKPSGLRLLYSEIYSRELKTLNRQMNRDIIKTIMYGTISITSTLFSSILIGSKINDSYLSFATAITIMGLGIGTTVSLTVLFINKINETQFEIKNFNNTFSNVFQLYYYNLIYSY